MNSVVNVAVKPVYIRNRNPVARDLKSAKYRPRIKPGKKKVYVRENNKFKLSEYKEKLTTLGKLVEYPEGRGWARDVDIDGSLIIETPEGKYFNLTSPLITEVK